MPTPGVDPWSGLLPITACTGDVVRADHTIFGGVLGYTI
jgi:hypothetical protein